MKAYIVMRQRYYDNVNQSNLQTLDIVEKLENARKLNKGMKSMLSH